MQLYKRTATLTFLATAAWISAVYADCIKESGVNTRECVFDPHTYECYKKGTVYLEKRHGKPIAYTRPKIKQRIIPKILLHRRRLATINP
ncbi:hypothetical protein OOU_Y34scaffold00128g1 [Pyricularia oryzae Y34]|uniref:Uncharacterized protein n=2 Tax=Pyricularia oryzae TaxID=318829 RepID=A0AA97P836_PYRO3|nr:hypothetical protein OOU_Y34scaffold00128g1 [Pyricularia oryzae Y34]